VFCGGAFRFVWAKANFKAVLIRTMGCASRCSLDMDVGGLGLGGGASRMWAAQKEATDRNFYQGCTTDLGFSASQPFWIRACDF
jgi:hypothetical protein